ncbi:MAG: DUF3574 domain-containing protein [Acetobacteraceae bacterium]|nr:DUF3574 domain-containing protein [Acetobacteraceae bacterium]
MPARRRIRAGVRRTSSAGRDLAVRPHRPIRQSLARFLRTIVTPRFPDGLTVLDGSGQFRNPLTGAIGSGPSRIVLIVTEDKGRTGCPLLELNVGSLSFRR